MRKFLKKAVKSPQRRGSALQPPLFSGGTDSALLLPPTDIGLSSAFLALNGFY